VALLKAPGHLVAFLVSLRSEGHIVFIMLVDLILVLALADYETINQNLKIIKRRAKAIKIRAVIAYIIVRFVRR
jgi:hypothetical protein